MDEKVTVDIQEVLAQLSERGRLEWELASERALRIKLQTALEALSEDSSSKDV